MHPLAALFAHGDWASRALLRHCADLDRALLERDVPGTRGSIRTTLTHLVGTEQHYLAGLTGREASDPIRRGDRRDPAALEPLARESAERWRAVLQDPRPSDPVVLVQCIHHGAEHRTQVLSSLAAAGAAEPALDVRAFGEREAWTPASWADALLPAFFAFSAWATREWLRHCASLGGPAMTATAPGTYGPVRDTLAHVVDVDGSYLSWLTGAPATLLTGAVDPDELLRHAAHAEEGWRAYLESAPDHERTVRAGAGGQVPAWLLTVQAVHHANEHRAHAGTALGASGLPVPEADAWAHRDHRG
jgi:uncharacterized damage-inducible protein DinB